MPEESPLLPPLSTMSLRDYFAAQALQGMCASMADGASYFTQIVCIMASEHNSCPIDTLAHIAYEQADAMIAAREK